jgi:hypothetical protein
MTVILFAIFIPAGMLYYFDYADLLTLGILALIVRVGEHLLQLSIISMELPFDPPSFML